MGEADLDARAEADRIIDSITDANTPEEANEKADRLATLMEDEAVLAHVYSRRDEVEAQLGAAKLQLAGVQQRVLLATLALTEPVPSTDVPATATLRGPQPERLLVGLILHQHMHETVPFDEDTVTRCLDPARTPNFDDIAEVFAGATGILRTASYYVLDAADIAAALASAPPEQDVLPPLPFPRVWIEASTNRRPVPYLRYQPDDRTIDVLGVGIVEVTPRLEWDVYLAFNEGGRPESFFAALRMGPHGIADVPGVGGERSAAVHPWVFAEFHRLAVGGVHLISARNVPHDEIPLPRAQRKRIARIGAPTPRLYYVNLASSGDHEPGQADGTPAHEYHVRWLVRGHWRHIAAGNQWCTCHEPPEPAIWIDPYVKGPVGAPWKGRQVRAA